MNNLLPDILPKHTGDNGCVVNQWRRKLWDALKTSVQLQKSGRRTIFEAINEFKLDDKTLESRPIIINEQHINVDFNMAYTIYSVIEEMGNFDLNLAKKPIHLSDFLERVCEINLPYLELIKQMEIGILMSALKNCNFNKTVAAEKLGLNPHTMREKCRRLGINEILNNPDGQTHDDAIRQVEEA